MLPFRVRHLRGVSRGRKGEDVIALTDLRGSPAPHYHPNLFATINYRQRGMSPHTLEKVLRSIGTAKAWAETRNRDLDVDLSDGNFLSETDVVDLVRFLGFSAAEQAVEHGLATKGAKIVSLRSRRRAGVDENSEVASIEVGTRIRYIAKYLEWHRHRRFDNRPDLTAAEVHLNASAASSIASLVAKAPSVSGNWHDEEALEAPDPALLKRIDEILTPGSHDNPFKSEFVQWRNYLAFRMLFDSGARRSEVKTAKTNSIMSRQQRFEIRESKTLARTVPIISKTAGVFDHYFENFWLNLPDRCEAHRTGELFTDQQGRPLTTAKFLNRMFVAVREIIGPQPWKISPHTMRRAWNHILSLKIDKMPTDKRPSHEEESEIRRRIMGWSDTSRQPARYNRRHIREAADRLSQEMMNDLSTPSNDYAE